jgi:hypothetical protein
LTDSSVKVTVKYERTKVGVHSKRNISKLKMTGIVSLILLLSIAIFSSTGGRSIALAQQQQPVTPPLPQANATKVLVANSSGPALYVPDLGLANFYGPANPTQHILRGVVEQPGVFTCSGDPTKCHVAGPGTFNGTFEQANKHNVTTVTATFKSPNFVKDTGVQKPNHIYKITTTDFNWNSTNSELPTPQPGFAKTVSDVGIGGQQHGLTKIDRSDVPQISESPGVLTYGHCDVTDTNTSQKVANVFCHLMVGHLINETNFYKYMRDDPITPNLGIVILASIPAKVQLPGNWSPYCKGNTMCTADEAQGFFPMKTDEALTKTPPFAYPVPVPYPRSGSVAAPGPSFEQPVSLNGHPFFFAFVVYPGVDIHEFPLKLEKTSAGK